MSELKDQSIEDELDVVLVVLDSGFLLISMLLELQLLFEQVMVGQQLVEVIVLMLVFMLLMFIGSLMLDVLEENCCFKVSIVCEYCLNLVWFVLSVEVKCYCCVMFFVMWSSKEFNQIMYCDGEFFGQEQEQVRCCWVLLLLISILLSVR